MSKKMMPNIQKLIGNDIANKYIQVVKKSINYFLRIYLKQGLVNRKININTI